MQPTYSSPHAALSFGQHNDSFADIYGTLGDFRAIDDGDMDRPATLPPDFHRRPESRGWDPEALDADSVLDTFGDIDAVMLGKPRVYTKKKSASAPPKEHPDFAEAICKACHDARSVGPPTQRFVRVNRSSDPPDTDDTDIDELDEETDDEENRPTIEIQVDDRETLESAAE